MRYYGVKFLLRFLALWIIANAWAGIGCGLAMIVLGLIWGLHVVSHIDSEKIRSAKIAELEAEVPPPKARILDLSMYPELDLTQDFDPPPPPREPSWIDGWATDEVAFGTDGGTHIMRTYESHKEGEGNDRP